MHARFLGNRKLGKFQRNWFSLGSHIELGLFLANGEQFFQAKQKYAECQWSDPSITHKRVISVPSKYTLSGFSNGIPF